MRKRKVLSLFLAAVALCGTLALTACGGSSAGSSSGTADAQDVEKDVQEVQDSAEPSDTAAADTAQEADKAAADTARDTEEAANYRTEEIWLKNGDHKIYGVMYLPLEEKDTYPTVICSHGFGGHSGATPKKYAPVFAENGYAAYCFDFCGGGKMSQSDGDTKEMSVLTEAADLSAVMDQLKELDYVDKDQLFLWGESQGGFVSSYVAAQRPDEVKGLLAMYPAYVLQDDAKKRNPDIDAMGDTEEMMGMTLGKIYTIDATSFDIYDELPKYTGPVLLLHGDEDPIVPIKYSKRASKAFPSVEYYVIKGGKHGFLDQALDQAIDYCLSFLAANTDQ